MSVKKIEQAQLVQTKNLIRSFPSEIALTRSGTETYRTGAGGIKTVNEPVTLNAVTRYFAAVVGDPVLVLNASGERVVAEYVLIGLPGDDIKEYDEFQKWNQTFWVIKVDETTLSFQTKAWVGRKGKTSGV